MIYYLVGKVVCWLFLIITVLCLLILILSAIDKIFLWHATISTKKSIYNLYAKCDIYKRKQFNHYVIFYKRVKWFYYKIHIINKKHLEKE